MLNNLFAALMLKIDVNIRGFFTFFANKTLKQEAVLGWVHGRYPKHITHCGICGRSAPLTQDFRCRFIPGKTNDVMDGQKVLRDIKLFDHRQLFVEDRTRLGRHPIGIALLGMFPCQFLKVILW